MVSKFNFDVLWQLEASLVCQHCRRGRRFAPRATIEALRRYEHEMGEPPYQPRDERCSSSSDRQTASPHTEMIDYKDAASNIVFRQRCKNFRHPRDHRRVAPIALAKQDDARFRGLGEREQARVVEIGSDDRSSLQLRPRNNGSIGFMREPDSGRMHGIMPAFDKPCRQCWR